MKNIFCIFIFVYALVNYSIAFAQEMSLTEARSKYASDTAAIKALIAPGSMATCAGRENLSNLLSSTIKSLDTIITKSENVQEVQRASSSRIQLLEMLSESKSSYEQICSEAVKKRKEDLVMRNNYVNTYNSEIIGAERFRDRAFNQDKNRYEMCNSLYAERHSLDKARTSFAILSGRIPEYAAEEEVQNRILMRKIEQNQVDGKFNGCW